VGYAVPPLTGLDKEKDQNPPLHYKGRGTREGNVKSKAKKPAKATAKSRGILRCAQDDCGKRTSRERPTLLKPQGWVTRKNQKVTASQEECCKASRTATLK
jgi:hypothetical protein